MIRVEFKGVVGYSYNIYLLRYTSYVSPISTTKLHRELSSQQKLKALETPVWKKDVGLSFYDVLRKTYITYVLVFFNCEKYFPLFGYSLKIELLVSVRCVNGQSSR